MTSINQKINNNNSGKKNVSTDPEEKEITKGHGKKKIPLRSTNGQRCLTKCYSKGTTYLHPILLTGVKDSLYDTCAVEPIHNKDPRYIKENDIILVDKCHLQDNMAYQLPNELDSILLSFYFNPRSFLESIYGVHSFDDVIYWTLENDYLPFDTIKRVHNCAWKVYGNKIEELSNIVLEYYYGVATDHWMKDYLKDIQNNYSFEVQSSKPSDEISENQQQEMKEIISKIFTYNFFVTSLKKYIYEFEDKWELIDSHYSHIKKYILNQLPKELENQ